MVQMINDAMWLTITNACLGFVVLAATIVVGHVFAGELYHKIKGAFATRHSTAHELYTPDLGMTMADGGEEIKIDDNLKDFHL
jgi:hypothetical protein